MEPSNNVNRNNAVDDHSYIIFLISLPRSGSTLLQRILSANSEICTTAEPWLMLHPLHAFKVDRYKAKYDHYLAAKASTDFLSNFPEKSDLFYHAARAYGLTMYSRALEFFGKRLFLDKTPRYYTILPELAKTFPRARYIILLRNPVAILSSVLQTWCNNDPSLLRRSANYVDIEEGPKMLLNGLEHIKNQSTIVHYENLVSSPTKVTKEICQFLNIDFIDSMINYSSTPSLGNRFGDQVGIGKYDRPVTASVDKWLNNLSKPKLRSYARRYIQKLGYKTFTDLGYDPKKIIAKLNQIGPENSDAFQVLNQIKSSSTKQKDELKGANRNSSYTCLPSSAKLNTEESSLQPKLKAEPVLIYQMGKVGSTSVMRSLNRIGIANQHVHRLSWEGIAAAEKRHRHGKSGQIPQHIKRYRALRNWIETNNNEGRWQIITLVRDPLARQISCVFQNLDVIMPKVLKIENETEQIGLIKNHMETYFKEFNEAEDDACNWFDTEILDVFGFDIFSETFDRNKGYKIYHTERADILVMRLEDLTRNASKAFEEFLGIKNFRLINSNASNSKSYASVYQKFLSSFRLDSDVLNRFYDTRFVRHFYTDGEIEHFKRRWNNTSAITSSAVVKSTIRVSAVISTYAAERFLGGRLQNLIDQTLYKDGKLEIIVIDSNSPQNEKHIVDEFQKRYSHIRYVRTSERETVYAAWNRGIDMAQGTYFVNANTDDRFAPDALEAMADALDSHPEFDAAYGNWLVTRTPNDCFDSRTPKNLFIYPEFHPGLFFYLQITSHASFLRRSIFDRIGAFDGTYTVFGDREFMFRFAAAGCRALKLERTIGLYLENPTSVERANKDIGRKECTALYDEYLAPKRFAALMGHDSNPAATDLARAYTIVGCFGMGLYDIAGNPAHALGTPARLLPKAIELDPNNIEALNNLGVVALHLESFQLGEDFLSNARSLANPEQIEVIDRNLESAKSKVSDPNYLQFLLPSDFRPIRVTQMPYRGCDIVGKPSSGKSCRWKSGEKSTRRKAKRERMQQDSLAIEVNSHESSAAHQERSARHGSVDPTIWNAYLKEDFSSATAALKQALQSRPDHWPAYMLLVDVMLQSGQAAAIPEQLRQLEAHSDLPADMLALVGVGYQAAGDIVSAADFAERSLAADPDCARAWNLKGVLAFHSGKMKEAAAYFQGATDNDASWGEPWTNLGTAHWEQGRRDKALDCLEKGLRRSPAAPNVATTYHAAVTETGEYERAKPAFADVVESHPDFRRARFLLIDILIRLEAYKNALEQIEAVIVRFGSDAQLLQAAKTVHAKVGPMTVDKGKRPSLSLCMIVKDEEHYLPRCLESLKPLVDEMIVVDTGSSDATRDIAEIFGAKVFDFEWNDDFAAARNHSLDQASGDWILVMDADEVIAAKDHHAIRDLIKEPIAKKQAYLMTTRNYTDRQDSANFSPNTGEYAEETSVGWVPSRKVRLFRNHQDVHFEFPVHEQVDPVLTEKGIDLKDCTVPVHHYGKLDKERTEKRWAMYYAIGRKKLDALGENETALKELAVQAALLSQWDEAASYWKRYQDLKPDSLEACLNLTRIMANIGNFAQARQYARQAFDLDGDRFETHYNLILSELQSGQGSESLDTARQMTNRFPDEMDGRLLGGIAELWAGHHSQGLQRVRELAREMPEATLSTRVISLLSAVRKAGFDEEVKQMVQTLSRIEGLQDLETTWNTTAASSQAVGPSRETVEKTQTIVHWDAAMRNYDREAYEDAFDALGAIIAGCPDHWDAYALLVDVMLQSGRAADVADQLRPLEQRGDLPSHMLALIGGGYEAADNLVRAADFADRALAADPDCAHAWNLKGMLAFRNGNMEEAAACFRRATYNDASWGEPWTNLGTAHWEQGRRDKALDCLEKGFRRSPAAPNVATAYHAAVTETGEYERAKPIFADVVESHPDFRRARFLLIDILIRLKAYLDALEQIEAVMVRFGSDAQLLQAAKTVRAKVGPKTVKNGKRLSLSLCMIVKDEEKYLPRCLESLKPLVDEMIVVDTGSSDATRDIAEVFGAQVFDFEWNDDFAAARNHSLDKASGDWILVMDADEVIAPSDHKALRSLIRKHHKKKAAFLITTRNYTHKFNSIGWVANDGGYGALEAGCGWIPSIKTRLFKNTSKIRFEYPVHELVDPALDRNGFRIKACSLPVHHYGFLDLDKVERKGAHYHSIGKRKLEQMQNDPKAIQELAVQANLLGDQREAISLWHRLVELQPKNVKIFINLSAAYGRLGDYENAKASARKAIAIDPKSKEGRLNLGRSEFFMGNFSTALKVFQTIVDKESDYHAARFMLGAAQICSNHIDEGMASIGTLKTLGIWNSLPHAFKDLAGTLKQAGFEKQAQDLMRCVEKIDKDWQTAESTVQMHTSATKAPSNRFDQLSMAS